MAAPIHQNSISKCDIVRYDAANMGLHDRGRIYLTCPFLQPVPVHRTPVQADVPGYMHIKTYGTTPDNDYQCLSQHPSILT